MCISGTGSVTEDQQYSHCGERVCQELGQFGVVCQCVSTYMTNKFVILTYMTNDFLRLT